jgi:chromosomal replication initiator protein
MISRLPGDGSPLSPDPETCFYTEIRNRISPRDYETWFRDLSCRFYPPSRFVLTASNRFQRLWLERNFRELLRTCARSLFDTDVTIEFSVRADASAGKSPQPSTPTPSPLQREPSSSKPDPAPYGAQRSEAPSGLPTDMGNIPILGSLRSPQAQGSRREAGTSRPKTRGDSATPFLPNADFTFENFVVGPNSRIAHAAVLATSESPGTTYNPLFIHGDAGVGKTHLLHALAHRILNTTRLKVRFLTALDFVQNFTQHARNFDLENHQRAYLEADVLIIDDVQFLAAKEKTQIELLRVFNALTDRGKQIVLSSRAAPRALSGMAQRLSSRFQAGLVAAIDSPGYDARVAIVLRKARIRSIDLPSEVGEFLASSVHGGVRELEGALLRVLNHATFHGTSPTLPVARAALQEAVHESPVVRSVTIHEILAAVQGYYGIKPKDLIARSKARSVTLPRQIAVFLIRQLTNHSLQEVGLYLGGRDHSTILYSEDRIAKLRQTDAKIRGDLQALRAIILSPPAL